ncbi:MAG TPA: hypothetical protein VHN77_12895, partial [Phycisphaerales bacterium]|nr:hypothetical protein [Phycisphaerales bacterium]
VGAEASHLRLVSNNAGQQININIGPVTGTVQVFGLNGQDATYTGVSSLEVETGSGQDFVEVRVRGVAPMPVSINTRANNSDVKFVYEMPNTTSTAVAHAVTVLGEGGNDKVTFEGVIRPRFFFSNWTVRQGGGNNEVFVTTSTTTNVRTNDQRLDTVSGSGEDVVAVNVESLAPRNYLLVRALTGQANDSVVMNFNGQFSGVTPSVPNTIRFFVDQNAGLDVCEANIVSRGRSANVAGTMIGGSGDDFLKLLLDGNGSVDTVMNGRANNDTVDVELKGTISGTPQLQGFTGDDYLKVVHTNGQVLTTPIVDGGDNFDRAVAFGTIVNVENLE